MVLRSYAKINLTLKVNFKTKKKFTRNPILFLFNQFSRQNKY